MTFRRILSALALAAAATAGCAPRPVLPPASGLPREALPPTFAPLRWSVRADDVPALFPNHRASQRAGAGGVTWTVSDVRRIEGLPGALAAEWSGGGDLRRARLSFPDPRRTCDPDLADRPRHCAEPATALVQVFDALAAELSRGRGAPERSPGPNGARRAQWRSTELAVSLALAPDARGASLVEAAVDRAADAAAR